MDASAISEYFAPLADWLKQQTSGQTCGWQPPADPLAAGTGATPQG
jgi:peptidyl-dipeptidase A